MFLIVLGLITVVTLKFTHERVSHKASPGCRRGSLRAVTRSARRLRFGAYGPG
ncbi:hypothetical protein [Paraburkholderia sp. JPY419]|uniref:hypothetical protein n=1 Tax=Paraburkholderia sp. JPY419 TaxID=667660 RepID=UPI003D229809